MTKLFTIGPMFAGAPEGPYEAVPPDQLRMPRAFRTLRGRRTGHDGHSRSSKRWASRFEPQLNSLGCPMPSRLPRDAAQVALELDESALCEDCRRRMVTNPLRVLDCKVPRAGSTPPKRPRFWINCPDCAAHFETVRRLLDAEKAPYVINHRLVRGLTTIPHHFEIVSDQIGAQGTGWRRALRRPRRTARRPNVSGLGFACGMERLALLLPQPEAGADRPISSRSC